jgi:hypothetical protein
MNSKQKGKRGELEAARLLREYGYDTHRGVQYKGGEDSPDVVGLPYCHLEIKRVEKLNIHEAIEQAKRDKGPDELSVVMHRKNNCEWLVTMPFTDWIRIFREYEAGESMKHGADSIDAAGSVSSDDNIQPLEVGDNDQK